MNDLEPFECVYLCVQGAGADPTIQGYGQIGRIPGSSVLPIVLAGGAVSPTRPNGRRSLPLRSYNLGKSG
jgi:hypothetical protein